MRISDWSSDVCSSDLEGAHDRVARISALVERHEAFARELDLDPGQVIGERLAALHALGDDARAASRPLDWQADVLGQCALLSSTLGASYLHAHTLDFGRCDARHRLDEIGVASCREWVW